LRRDLVVLHLLAELDDLLHRDGRLEDRVEDLVLAVLDALGDLDLALAGEQRDRAHLAEVHPHRVVALARVGVVEATASASSGIGTTRFSWSSSAARLAGTFTWLLASTTSISSSPRMPISSSIWSARCASVVKASLISS
jgi:hypothetical protein